MEQPPAALIEHQNKSGKAVSGPFKYNSIGHTSGADSCSAIRCHSSSEPNVVAEMKAKPMTATKWRTAVNHFACCQARGLISHVILGAPGCTRTFLVNAVIRAAAAHNLHYHQEFLCVQPRVLRTTETWHIGVLSRWSGTFECTVIVARFETGQTNLRYFRAAFLLSHLRGVDEEGANEQTFYDREDRTRLGFIEAIERHGKG
jgi:predicted CxxxxCH...CXXCH cytochrome family protein